MFPKLNFSWIAVDREGQAPLAGVLTLFRPRVAFGVAGVQPDPGQNLRLLSGGDSGVTIATIGNTQLRPEKSREIEGGFDAQLWSDRLAFTVSAYHKLRVDAIVPTSTAPSVLGTSPLFVNIGRIRNRGIEVTADATLIETPVVRWGVRGALSANRNVLLSVNAATRQYVAGQTQFREGYPLDGVWARPIAAYTDPDGDGRLTPGDVALADQPVYLGSSFPKYALPFSTDLSLLRGTLGISAGFDYTNGITQTYTGGRRILSNLYFKPNATLGEQAAALASVGESVPYGLVQTINSLRFNTVSLNYHVPQTWSRRVGVPMTNVAVQGSNLRLWTTYRGKDPNVNANTVGEGIRDDGQLPLPRSWSIRVELRN